MDKDEQEIQELERQLKSKKLALKSKQDNCDHKFPKEPVYDPEKVREPIFSHYEGHGSDPVPKYNYHDKEVPRWSRTCTKCGLKQYTKEKKATKYEPKFD